MRIVISSHDIVACHSSVLFEGAYLKVTKQRASSISSAVSSIVSVSKVYILAWDDFNVIIGSQKWESSIYYLDYGETHDTFDEAVKRALPLIQFTELSSKHMGEKVCHLHTDYCNFSITNRTPLARKTGQLGCLHFDNFLLEQCGQKGYKKRDPNNPWNTHKCPKSQNESDLLIDLLKRSFVSSIAILKGINLENGGICG